MARYNKTDVQIGDNVKSDVNVQLGLIETAIGDSLSRKGDLPNTMEADLDMNSNQILNIPDAKTLQEPVSYAQLLSTTTLFQAADAKFYDSVALAQADTSLVAGDVIIIKERASALFDVISGTGTANTFDIVAHATLSLSFSLRETSEVNIVALGAKPNTSTDTAPILQRVVDLETSSSVFFPEGEYSFFSGVVVGRALTIKGAGFAGSAVNSSSSKSTTFLVKEFSGDLLTFDGSAIAGAIVGSGGGVQKLAILNKFGTSGSANGSAIVITGADSVNRATWVKIVDVEINKYTSSYADFTYGVDIDGTTVTKAIGGIRDIFISRTRIASDSGASNAIRVRTGFNIFIDSVSMNLANGSISLTGVSATDASGSIRISNSYGAGVFSDYVDSVYLTGGNYTSLTATANSSDIVYSPSKAGVSDNKSIVSMVANSRYTIMNNNGNTAVVGRDLNAGDSTNTTQLDVGNINISQGSAVIAYQNADPVTGTQNAYFYLKGRNAANTGLANHAYIRMNQVAGTDSAQMQFYCGSDRRIYCYQQGNHNIQLKGSLLPETSATYNLGSASQKWGKAFLSISTFADDASAGAGGIAQGQLYKTATGQVMIKL